MNPRTSSSPKTPQRKRLSWKHDSPTTVGSPGCSSTPSRTAHSSDSSFGHRALWNKSSPSKLSKLVSSPISKHSLEESKLRLSGSFSVENETDKSSNISKHASCTDPSWSVKTFSSTESNGTLTVELTFPHGGWDEDKSSSDSSSCSLEIVESEAEVHSSPNHRGRKRKQSEVSEEDNAILSGMGEEIERQLEAKAERNRLTVPNVKNILRSVITNPYVQAMVRRSIKSGDVAVSGDSDDISFEPRMTRAKAKMLCDDSNICDAAWSSTPVKLPPTSECHALIHDELSENSEDDEEYQPGEDEHSDNDLSERDGSERGSERDISIEQSPACGDTDTESCPATPNLSPKPPTTETFTQTNWSEDGVFKVPLLPPEPHCDHQQEENIALRTRSKLPLNDTPLEEIEQAFIPPDITPDLYDTTCDNADWQEFLKEFMQPMRSEPEIQNHDDDENDPEYNVLADEEIIDKEELRKDRAVRVSKRELNELMRELLEFTENLSSDDEDKNVDKTNGAGSRAISPGIANTNNPSSSHEDMSLYLDSYMSLGTLTPMAAMKTTPPIRSPNTPTLNTPVPPMSPPIIRTPGTGKKFPHNDMYVTSEDNTCLRIDEASLSVSAKGKPHPPQSGKKQPVVEFSPFKYHYVPKPGHRSSVGKNQSSLSSSAIHANSCISSSLNDGNYLAYTPQKPDYYFASHQSGKTYKTPRSAGKLDSFSNSSIGNHVEHIALHVEEQDGCNSAVEQLDNFDPGGLVGVNVPVRVTVMDNEETFYQGEQYSVLNISSTWESDKDTPNTIQQPNTDFEKTDWNCSEKQDDNFHSLSQHVDENIDVVQSNEMAQANEDDEEDRSCSSDPEVSVSLPLSSNPSSPIENHPDTIEFSGDIYLSNGGDIIVDNQVVLSSVQRLVLDQQIRQYVQFLTQHFLQTYQHPVHGKYAPICKRNLLSLSSLAGKKENSAFKAANLEPALQCMRTWEDTISSSDGPDILKFMENEVSIANRVKIYRKNYYEKLSPKLLTLMANSKAFIYPQLLPQISFRSVPPQKMSFMKSEEHLSAIGLEVFEEYIKENNPGVTRCVQWAFKYVAEYLVVARDAHKLYRHIYNTKIKREGPVQYYLKHKRAPPTSHFVLPFNERKMIPLKAVPSHSLPTMFRDFIYPAGSR